MKIEWLDIEVFPHYLVYHGKVQAFAWHYNKEKAFAHLMKIKTFHKLDGKLVTTKELDQWLLDELNKVVLKGQVFSIPPFPYTYLSVYQSLCQIPRGKTITYGELAKTSGIKYTTVLTALMRNPFQVLIPCHRLVTKKGTLMGFYPLGKDIKRKLLTIEGAL